MLQLLRTWHRWVGLAIAGFLFVSGLTGALIAWDHELDAALNPKLYLSDTAGPPISSLALADQLETERPGTVVTYLPLATEPGHTLMLWVEQLPGAGDPIDYNQVALDPASGQVLGTRMWGAAVLDREHLMPFLYHFHYSLHLPMLSGVEIGVLLLGIVAILWVIDSLVAIAISFPSPATWRKSFAFRWRQGGARLLFDLHRSGGVWVWMLVMFVAITSVSMNLEHEVVRPIVNVLSPLKEGPFDGPPGTPPERHPAVSRGAVVASAVMAAKARGIQAPPGAIFYSSLYGIYGVGFFAPGMDHGDGGLGNPWFYFDSTTGAAVGADIPGEGSAGDLYMQLQFPLHSGRIAGTAGRIAVSVLGVLIAGLSLTGVLLWLRRRRAARLREASAFQGTADGLGD